MTAKKIIVVQGGGRPKGNTFQLVQAFMDGAAEAGHLVDYVSLNRLTVNGCLGCNACRYQKPCVQKDDFGVIRGKIGESDCLVFASPLLFWTISAKLKAFIERFYCLAEEDPDPPLGRYEKYPALDCALLMTSADNLFWTYEQAVSYYRFAIVNYIGFRNLGMLLAGGCGDTNGSPRIASTPWLEKARRFGLELYREA